MTEPVDMLFVPVIRRASHVVRFVGGREWVVPLGDAERIAVEYAEARVAEATADQWRLRDRLKSLTDERYKLLAELERERSIRATAEEIAESSRHFDWSVALAKSEIEVRRLQEQVDAVATSSDGPLIAPRLAPIADNRDAVARAMCALGSAYRGDWSTFDGRTLKLSMEDLSAHLHDSADPVTYEKLCADEGVCPVERCWTECCSKSQRHTCEHLASLTSQRTESTS